MMRNKAFISLVIFFCTSQALAQNWANAGVPLTVSQIRTIFVDTLNSKMYTAGYIPYSTGGKSTAFCTYDGTSWSEQDSLTNIVFTLNKYWNELYIGGAFMNINSQPAFYLAKYNGTNWVNIGASGGSILNLKVIDDELYAVGSFTNIAGVNASNIAKFNGSTWIGFNFPNSDPSMYVADCAVYNGELYAAGNFNTITGLSDICVLKSGGWKRVGGSDSLRGSFCEVAKLEVYKNYLYAAGAILKSEGNVGNGIQAWDGQVWKSVGTGVQGIDNDFNTFSQVQDMVQYKGKLFVCGMFYFVGNVPAPSIGVWDGIKWCGIDRNMDKVVTDINVFNDTIYIGTSAYVEGQYVNSFAKFMSGNYTYSDTCSKAFYIGFKEYNFEGRVNVYPNPTTSSLNIFDEQNNLSNSTIEITNSIGQTVLQLPFSSSIDVSTLPEGCYFITITTRENQRFRSKFVKC